MERARKLANQQKFETGDGMKTIAVFVGLFLETSIHVCLYRCTSVSELLSSLLTMDGLIANM